MAFSRILCAVDGSAPSQRAVSRAADLARSLNAKLTIILVHTYSAGGRQLADIWLPEEVVQVLGQSLKTAQDAGCKDVDTAEIRARDPAYAIVDYAEEFKADLVVVGSSGKSAVRRVMLGSVSLEVVQKSICPVMVVH